MKLQEALTEKTISDLGIELYDAVEQEDQGRADRAQSMMVATLLNDGWSSAAISKFINSIKSAGSKKDILKILVRTMHLKEAVEEPTVYKLSFTVPFVSKENSTAAVREALKFVEKNRMKIVKQKIVPGPKFKAGQDEEVMNIDIYVSVKTKYDRYRVKRLIQKKYKLNDLSYSKKDGEI